MPSRIALAVLTLLVLGSAAHADEITTIESELSVDSLGADINLELATNIWDAHETTPYALVEADSLELSIEAVLRALSVAGIEGAFIQSNIAIDDRAGIGILVDGVPCNSGCTLDFGDVNVGSSSTAFTVVTPEPGEWLMLLCGLDALLIAGWLRTRRERV